MAATKRVLIIDDSSLLRTVVRKILEKDPELSIVGAATDPIMAKDMILRQKPDVITLDIEMPRMDGITFLEKLMKTMPIPTVIVSSLAESKANVTLKAFDLGAFECVEKPKIDVKHGMEEISTDLIRVVKAASRTRPIKMTPERMEMLERKYLGKKINRGKIAADRMITTDKVVALGASTGGTVATEEVLAQLPTTCAPIVIVQHMPENFTAAYAARLNQICDIEIEEITSQTKLLMGHAYICQGGRHVLVKRVGGEYFAYLDDSAPRNRHRPSVDVMFESFAENVGPNAVGVILTGMGADGAEGMRLLHDAGAKTIAQDESTSVVYGMPHMAVEKGGVDKIVPLQDIARNVMDYLGAI